MVGGVICACDAAGGAKSNETTSQSEYLAPTQLLLTCFHPLLTPRANTKHKIILFYLPFRQPEWLRLKLPHDPHGQSSDMYTPSLWEHLRFKWDEETDKGLTRKWPDEFLASTEGLCLSKFNKLDIVNTSLSPLWGCAVIRRTRLVLSRLACKLLNGLAWDDSQVFKPYRRSAQASISNHNVCVNI